MASPVGHAIIGVTAAAVVAGATGAPSTPALWIGALGASIAPDVDLALRVFGLSGPRFHRNATHSILMLGVVLALSWAVRPVMPFAVDWRALLACSAALLTHPLLDVVTTGPATARAGYGIALLWPFHRHRWFVNRPLFESLDLSKCRSIRDVWAGVRPELLGLLPPATMITAVALWV